MNIFEFYDKIEFKEEAEMLIHRIQKMGSDVIIGADGIINVEGDVNISGSFYRRLPVRFGKVDGDFLAHFSDLETLEGAPKEVTGLFDVTSCNLRSLEGGPNNPTKGYYCSDNFLTSLKGVPEVINGHFDCSDNFIDSLEYFPKVVNGNVVVFGNKKIWTEEEIEKICKVSGYIVTDGI